MKDEDDNDEDDDDDEVEEAEETAEETDKQSICSAFTGTYNVNAAVRLAVTVRLCDF